MRRERAKVDIHPVIVQHRHRSAAMATFAMNVVSPTQIQSLSQIKQSGSQFVVPVHRASRASVPRNNTRTYSGKASPRHRSTSLVAKAAVEKSVETVKEAAEIVDPTAMNSNIKIDPKDVIMIQVSCVLLEG